MNMKAVIPLAVAGVFGLIAAILVHNAMSRKANGPAQASNTVSVVAALRPVAPGAALTLEDLKVIKAPADSTPGQVFSDPTKLVGRTVVSPLVEGETILEPLLSPSGNGTGLQALIPAGMRAITLEINEFSGVAGMILPGCRVDVISILNDTKTKEQVARTVLQNLKVTAVGRSTTPPAPPQPGQPAPGPANNVTILCTPKQAQTLHLASASGRPWLVLRNAKDAEQPETDGTSMAELRGDADSGINDVFASATDQTLDANTTAAPTLGNDSSNTTATVSPVSLPTQSGATTRPVSELAPIRRIVQVIRGGAESQVVFQIPRPRVVTADINAEPSDDN